MPSMSIVLLVAMRKSSPKMAGALTSATMTFPALAIFPTVILPLRYPLTQSGDPSASSAGPVSSLNCGSPSLANLSYSAPFRNESDAQLSIRKFTSTPHNFPFTYSNCLPPELPNWLSSPSTGSLWAGRPSVRPWPGADASAFP